ncbi:MAG: DNA polymerase I [Alphaproteobacteria bacterium MarineAlpha11_Bin1]|nr:MAG: DNA polymerase I [Alphaproteobacteria bacterium MarineAlpha11_Bin1]|tara:strand:+ start:15109 stop:18153 length:3045 start_codon:yes stop_codon:yes gene_type:complete
MVINTSSNGATDHIYLVDGSAYIFRAFHALPPMTRPDGTPVNAVYGFTNMLTKLVEDSEADFLAVIFDTARKTFRTEIYPEYKANRPPPPEELVPQFDLIREATRAYSLPCLELEGFEADDLIATYARLAVEQGYEVTIVSSDKDLMQLVRPGVRIMDPMKNRFIGADEVFEKFGVGPENVVDVQALLGDSTDNVPGIKGIGEAPAAALVREYGNLDNLIEAVKNPEEVKAQAVEKADNCQARIYNLAGREFGISSPKQLKEVLIDELKLPVPKDKKTGKPTTNAAALRELAAKGNEIAQRIIDYRFYSKVNSSYADLIHKEREIALLSRELVTLRADVPVEGNISAFRKKRPDPDVLIPWLEEQGFKSALSRARSELGIEKDILTPDAEISLGEGDYELVQDEAALQVWVDNIETAGVVAFDTETDSLDSMQASLVGLSLSIQGGSACYVPLAHVAPGEESNRELDLGREPIGEPEDIPRQIPLNRAIEILKPMLENPGILKVGHNIKYDMQVMLRHGVEVAPIDDTMLLSYVLEGGLHGHGLDELAILHLGHTNIKFSEVAGTGKKQITFDQVPLDKALNYAAEDAEVTGRLYRLFKPRIAEESMAFVYETLERRLVPVLSAIERAGIIVDATFLKELSSDFEKRTADIAAEIYELADHEFNIGSPKQLGEVLFEELGIEGGKKTKSGAYGTGADVLEGLAAQGHQLPSRVLDWRQLSKLRSTYTDALVKKINPETKRIHTSYAQAIASTGRLSSTDPNLQNIPIRTEEGRKIRQAFVPEKGCVLMSADYSQIELRLLAHVAKIEVLREAFRDGQDIHAMTASEVFGVPVDGMDSSVRNRAKAINFGIIYGISPFGLARQLSIPQGDAKHYIESYFEKFPGIKDYMETTKNFAREHGYVQTLFGRKCHTPGIQDKNPARRNFSERAAINAPLQGAAADIIKRAMIQIPGDLANARLGARMLLQVHDELIFEVPEEEINETATTVSKTMEDAAHLSVPLVIDIGTGLNWDEAH